MTVLLFVSACTVVVLALAVTVSTQHHGRVKLSLCDITKWLSDSACLGRSVEVRSVPGADLLVFHSTTTIKFDELLFYQLSECTCMCPSSLLISFSFYESTELHKFPSLLTVDGY